MNAPNGIAIIYPILAHIVLVLGLYIMLGLRKAAAIKNRSADLKETALNNQAWPPSVIQVSNNIANQFETPVLFHILCLIILISGTSTILALTLSWLYVMLRYVHAFVHIRSNFIPHRFLSFALSMLVMLGLLIQVIVQLADRYII